MSEDMTNASELSQPAVGPAVTGDNGPAAVDMRPVAEQPRTGWEKFKLIFKVVEVRLRFIAILIAVAFFVGYWDSIKNHWEKQTRSDGGVYGTVRAVLGEKTTHWLWPQSSADGSEDSDTEYYCPMHPNVVRPTLDPNGAMPKCPICGMPLSPRKKGEAPKLPEGVLSRKQLSPEQIQLAGVRTVEVAYQLLTKELTTVGYVGYDESRRSRIVSRVSGYLEKLYVDKPWITVKEGDPLAEIYSPELYSAARELLLALDRRATSGLAESGREKLRLLGIGDKEIDEIVESRRANHRLVVRSPRTGHVIRKDVVEGAHVETGQTLFEVADLSTVWIEAEVYEADIEFLREGQTVEATVEAFRNRTFNSKVSLVHPHLDPSTRTNAVRFELENPGHKLRPGMFATVRIRTPLSEIEPFATLAAESLAASSPIRSAEPREYFACPSHPDVMMDQPGDCPKCKTELERRPLGNDQRLIWWCPMHPKVTSDKSGGECDECSGMKLVPKLTLLAKEGEVLAVPERAVIDTGSKQIVYVEREPGQFEGVQVELGPRSGGFYPVVKGLEPGDRIAAAGSFLIDAETRLNPAAAATYIGASGGPSSGKSATSGAGATMIDAETRLNPASQKPSADDLKNIGKLAPADRELAVAQRLCPVSGEPLGSMGMPHKLTVKGQTIFLCCKGCDSEVNKEPDKFLKKVAELKAEK
jgi:Cu(I)/Ag(I) efflux system membrane fusion protein